MTTNMKEQLQQTLPRLADIKVVPATDVQILTYLRKTAKYGETAAAAERQAIILAASNEFDIEVSDEEWQVAGDAFRQEHKLWGTSETITWLEHQRIGIEEWSQGIKEALLTKKLKEHLFGAVVDGGYINDRDRYRRVALSQILVAEPANCRKILQMLEKENASFCALALEFSQGKQSQENGGFVGTRFLIELTQEIIEAIKDAKEGEIIGPIKTKLGYHILRVEKWFNVELKESVRDKIIDSLFTGWLQDLIGTRDYRNSI
jgi:parvulin-like peptidyl-prolyl isomerase